jgi:hypothetical protein
MSITVYLQNISNTIISIFAYYNSNYKKEQKKNNNKQKQAQRHRTIWNQT